VLNIRFLLFLKNQTYPEVEMICLIFYNSLCGPQKCKNLFSSFALSLSPASWL